MKKNFSKKILSFALAFTLIIGMLPQISTAAFAGTGSTEGAYWPNFRGSDTNMAITSVETPREKSALKWSNKLATGWSDAPSVQIIVDNALVTMHGKTISKLNLATGEIIASGTMVAAPNWGYTPATYADGMIFCPLTGGKIQAFDAKTLESLWVYTDPLGGQSLSPITYSDGHIYTGFWNSETKDANYVCINITDEDKTMQDEAKTAKWTFTKAGGFYWAGSVVIGDSVIVGTDDGASGSTGNGKLYSLNKATGAVITELELTGAGDQRSSIAYDKANSKIYFTSKGGYLFSASVNVSTGVISELKGEKHASQSTSTPVVYKGRIYYGATDGGFGSGKVVVADANTLEKLFEVNLKGYPQCSLLLSTAYEESEDYLYLYSTYNNNPGGISLIKVKPDCKTIDDSQLIEVYNAEGFEQYCITSIICGPDGTLYYKNDSGNVLAVGVTDTESVENLINKIGTVTIDSESAIKAAREAYDSLSDKDAVSNYSVLEKAEKDFEVIAKKVDDVEALITAIGKVSNDDVTKAKVKAARDAYDKLSEAEKAKVENYHVLTAAEIKLDKLKGPGTVEITANKDNAYSGSLDNSSEEIYNKLLTAEEKALVEQGTNVKVSLSVKDISTTVSASNKALIEKNLGKNKVGLYLDITLSKQLGENGAVNVTETNGKVKVTISVPDSLKNNDASITRTYKIMRIHEGKVDILDAVYDAKTGKLVFETDAFSTYALVYSDAPVQTTAPKTGDDTNMMPWLALMAVAGIVAVAYKKKED